MKQIKFYMILTLMMLILVMISMLISVAFLTLMERKMLSYIQIRKGPNKLGLIGFIQPFSDAIKLLTKEMVFLSKMNYFLYLFSPIMSLILMLMMWLIYPFWVNCLNFNLGLIYLMCCFSLGGYGLLMAGWSSNSMYSLLGSIRSLAQSISYEVSLAIIMIVPMMLLNNFSFMTMKDSQWLGVWLMVYMWPLGFMFFFSIMAELNRTPFDFSEGESELVSGFNVEYMSTGFIMIFLAEYSSILFLSFMFVLFYLGGDFYNMSFYFKVLFITFMVIWMRGTFPRFRYDLLMNLCWLIVLPFSLNYMFYMILFKYLIY